MTVFRDDPLAEDRVEHARRRDVVANALAWLIVVALGAALTVVVVRVGW
jgi:hypothetical protein